MDSKAKTGGLGGTLSAWVATEAIPLPEKLQSDTSADVCIVGAGISGLTSALLLLREGKSVVVLEADSIGSGQTGRTTAHLSNALDDRYFHLQKIHGKEGAKLAAESHTAAIDRIEEIIRSENILCDFERLDGYLFAPLGQSIDDLEKEYAAAKESGLIDIALVNRLPITSFESGPALKFSGQAQLHPMKYLHGLYSVIERMGGKVFCKSFVEKIKGGDPATVTTREGFTVNAEHIIVATNVPINDLVAIHTKQAPYRSYAIGARIPYKSVPQGLYWDTLDPYHYIRTQTIRSEHGETYDLLIVGGEDHKTGQDSNPEKKFSRLEKWAKSRFPMIESIDYRWSGQVLEPVDGLAFIGRNPMDSSNVFIITGDSGHGMTHGTLGGMIITDLIQGRPNKWARLYEPSRKCLRAAMEFAKENSNVALQYADWFTGGDVKSEKEIPKGQGAVIRHGPRKIAVYRDENGTVQRFSAVCTHLGGVVAWNSAEKSWDCPCHGSRFDACGKVVEGPANTDLRPIDKTPVVKGPVRKAPKNRETRDVELDHFNL